MIKIYPSKLNGTINAEASKAHAQRLLFMSALAEIPTLVKNVPDCEDIDTTIRCLLEMGCRISINGKDVLVEPFPKNIPVHTVNLDFKNSSTSCKIALAICSALGINCKCTGSDTLKKRRMLSITSKMALRGARFTNFSLPLELNGKLEGGEFSLEGDEGSQNISALLMALPLCHNDSEIKLNSAIVDDSFIKLTIDSLKAFGINIEKTETGFNIKGRQFYKSPGTITCENDWGLAAMWITAGAASEGDNNLVTVNMLPKNSHQKYREISGPITFIHYDYQEMDINAKDCPNLATLFASLSIVKGATMEISGIPQLKYKETNRLKLMEEIAYAMGQKCTVMESRLTIRGLGYPNYKENTIIDCKGDAWVFMSMVLASTKATVPYILTDEHCANKIYRRFLEDFKLLGGQYEIIEQ